MTRPHSPVASSRQGIILSIEVMLAALVLFGGLLIAAQLSGISSDAPSSLALLRYDAMDVLSQGIDSGAFEQPVSATPNDTLLRALLDNLPPAICAQADIYLNDTSPAHLVYDYVPAGCNTTIDLPVQSYWRSMAVWRNSSYFDIYWVRVRAYPSGGGS